VSRIRLNLGPSHDLERPVPTPADTSVELPLAESHGDTVYRKPSLEVAPTTLVTGRCRRVLIIDVFIQDWRKSNLDKTSLREANVSHVHADL